MLRLLCFRKTIISFTSKIIAITVSAVVIIAEILVLKPSIPSVKLIAFVVASITNIINGIYIQVDSVIYVLKNGIKVCVPKLTLVIKYIVKLTDIISSPSILLDGLSPFVSLSTSFL